VLLNQYKIAVKRCSEDSQHTLVHDFKTKSQARTDYAALQYVTCVYEAEWWVGIIFKVDHDEGDA